MKYKIKFNEYQLNVFRKEDFNGSKLKKLQSVLSYLIKYSENNKVMKSLNRLYKMYKRYHFGVSRSYFFELVNTLIDLDLAYKKDKYYFIINSKVDKIIDKKMDNENPSETVENTEIESDSDLPNIQAFSLYNSYSIQSGQEVEGLDIISIIKKYYLGLKKSICTKKDLKDIAICLFTIKKITNRLFQATIFSRIKHSKRKIEVYGAVAYIEKMIDRLQMGEDEIKIDINQSILPNQNRFNCYAQREYNTDLILKLENMSLV